MNRLFGAVTLAAMTLSLFACDAVEPVAKANPATAAMCGTATIVDLAVRTEQRTPEPVYTLTFRLNDTSYTAEAAGGRISLFGPLVENARINLCVRGEALTLTTPRDEEPEVLTYKMNIIRRVRTTDLADAS